MAWRFHLPATLIASLLLSSSAAGQQDALAQAKALYGSAAYNEALAMLERLQQGSVKETGIEIALYRMFCLVVLDRPEEAGAVIEEIVEADPFFQPSASQASPRIRTIFEESRRAILPSVVRQLYTDAREAFRQKDPSAAQGFDAVVRLLDDPALRDNESLSDLRILATEFRDLVAAQASIEAGRAAAKPSGAAVATEADRDVQPPVPVSQAMPAWSPVGRDARQTFRGEVELLIDERGNVSSARVRQPIHPDYDDAIVRQARSWKYKPATRNGVATRFLKVIRVQLTPPPGD